ncbi:MAG: F0F1 ATP synthase subunit epsilon [Negativicutes bacterium]|nr:F0F1 ATP synthase subunit epsilon [Negativicutes bacterium]
MAGTFEFTLVTPERVVYAKPANMLIARTTEGDIGVLPSHARLMAALKSWPVRIMTDDGRQVAAVSGGFIEVRPDRVTVLADTAELAGNIDVGRAQAAKERAESRLRDRGEGVDIARAERALRRAEARLLAASWQLGKQ